MQQADAQSAKKAQIVERLITAEPPRAASFIVTVYGDVVEPRGGVLWMGTLIEICGEVGLSETLVRTAVSRLVAAGRLAGERIGRRSYYRLTAEARREFTAAASLLFEPGAKASDLALVLPRDAQAGDELEAAGFARLGRGLMLGPDRDLRDLAAMRLPTDPQAGGDTLRVFAAETWDLDRHGAAYDAFQDRFAPLEEAIPTLSPRDQLVARLLLIHAYRAAVLRDPHLPPACLPRDWPGTAAAQLFARLYLRLARASDSHIGTAFSGEGSPLQAETPASRARLQTLESYLAEAERP